MTAHNPALVDMRFFPCRNNINLKLWMCFRVVEQFWCGLWLFFSGAPKHNLAIMDLFLQPPHKSIWWPISDCFTRGLKTMLLSTLIFLLPPPPSNWWDISSFFQTSWIRTSDCFLQPCYEKMMCFRGLIYWRGRSLTLKYDTVRSGFEFVCILLFFLKHCSQFDGYLTIVPNGDKHCL